MAHNAPPSRVVIWSFAFEKGRGSFALFKDGWLCVDERAVNLILTYYHNCPECLAVSPASVQYTLYIEAKYSMAVCRNDLISGRVFFPWNTFLLGHMKHLVNPDSHVHQQCVHFAYLTFIITEQQSITVFKWGFKKPLEIISVTVALNTSP